MLYTSLRHLFQQTVKSKWKLIFDDIQSLINLLKIYDSLFVIVHVLRRSEETHLHQADSQCVNSTFLIVVVYVLLQTLCLFRRQENVVCAWILHTNILTVRPNGKHVTVCYLNDWSLLFQTEIHIFEFNLVVGDS